SRDPAEPEASLHALAAAVTAHAPRAKEAPGVPSQVQALHGLFAAVCAEGGQPRLTQVLSLGAVSCGQSRALEEAGLARTRAHVTRGDPLRAVAAFERAELPPATRTAKSVAEAQSWLAQAAPVAQATSVRALNAIPAVDRGAGPSWGALAFEPDGTLLVRA